MFLLSEELKEITVSKDADYSDLLVPVVIKGKVSEPPVSLAELRERVKKELSNFNTEILNFNKPGKYQVGLEKALYEKREAQIEKIRNRQGTG